LGGTKLNKESIKDYILAFYGFLKMTPEGLTASFPTRLRFENGKSSQTCSLGFFLFKKGI